MKKIISVLLSILMLVSCCSVVSFAEGEITYEQPFAPYTEGSRSFRIPSIITLQDGSVLAAVDMRYDHGSDSPHNLDTLIAHSEDGYTGWETSIVNYFDDYAHGYSDANSASFIDPAMVQTSSGRIFMIVDAFPSGGGSRTAEKGTGYVELDGHKYLALTNTDDITKSIDKFEYILLDFEGDYAKIVKRDTRQDTGYYVDKEYDLYKNGQPVMVAQNGSDEQVQQNVFYVGADFTMYHTMHLWLRYSDDNGKTWSDPQILTPQIKEERESFLAICPGKGYVTTVNGKERIIFCVYDNSTTNILGVEMVSTIYSDDGGVTWQRGERVLNKIAMIKTSESQIVTLPDGTLRMFSRNESNYVGYSDSTDGGVTWTTSVPDTDLEGTKNCMVSFINYNAKKINGKSVIIGSYASNVDSRADGVVRVGLVDSNNNIDWISTYHLNQGFFAYSCLTELADGNIGVLCEDELDYVRYRVLSINDDGELTDVSGNNIEFQNKSQTVWEKIVSFFKNIFKQIQIWFGIL